MREKFEGIPNVDENGNKLDFPEDLISINNFNKCQKMIRQTITRDLEQDDLENYKKVKNMSQKQQSRFNLRVLCINGHQGAYIGPLVVPQDYKAKK